jgi:hypothetical protein
MVDWDLGVLALGAAMFAVLMILAITTTSGDCGLTSTAADGASVAGGFSRPRR